MFLSPLSPWRAWVAAGALLASPLAFSQGAALSQKPTAPTSGHGIRLADMDPHTRPGDDFYGYTNGAWQRRTEIAADRTAVSGFSEVAERTSAQISAIVHEAANAHAAAGTDTRRIADLYASAMNDDAKDAHGVQPLTAEFAQIDAVRTQHDLAGALGQTLRTDVDALNLGQFHTANLFGLWVAPGFHDPHHYAPYLFEGGLTLPSRDYYVDGSARMADTRKQYAAFAATMFRLAGFSDPDDRAARVAALETEIAKVHISLADSENIRKADNLWTASKFATEAPGLDWAAFFQTAALASQKEFYVWQPSAVIAEAALVGSTPIATWQDFLRLHTILAHAGALSKDFRTENFRFFGTVLLGAPEQRPLERRSIDLVNGQLDQAVGKLYASRYFPEESKRQAQALVANLLAVYHQRLDALTWMAPSTKAEALAKLKTLRVSVGYADRFRSYDGLDITPDDLAGNLHRIALYDYHYNLDRIGKPTDPDEWCMPPQLVNAVQMPLNNALNFPAAILQPPFFDATAPAAANYGAIGSVIGHEISHTFDSEGSDFDSEGRVRDWWTEADRAHFNASTAALAAQFDSYEPLPGVHVNGKQTLGEDIADLAGVTAALDAYHVSLGGKTAAPVGGFTGDQQFFIAFGQNWQGKARDAALRRQILTDPHAPGPIRALTVRNLDAWYADFDVKSGQKLYLPETQRVHIF